MNGHTFERIRELIAVQLGTDEERVSLDMHLVDDLATDAFDLVELLAAVEDEFGLRIPEGDAQRLSTVRELVAYVEERL